ncbi:unnamed protein product, partial [Staurois parvus]
DFAFLGRGCQSRQSPVITEHLQRGGELYVNNTVLLPVSLCTLLKQRHTDTSKYSTQLTLLIAPHVNPFLPSAISTVSVLFF